MELIDALQDMHVRLQECTVDLEACSSSSYHSMHMHTHLTHAIISYVELSEKTSGGHL